jgi:hypothetical protein
MANGEHRRGQLITFALGHRAHQLLQVECVALRLVHDARHGLGGDRLAERLPHQALACLAAESAERDLFQGARTPEPGEEVLHLGPPEREHHQRLVRELAQRGVDQVHSGRVAPVQILQEEQHGAAGALQTQPVDDGSADLLAHEPWVAPGHAQPGAGLSRHGHAAHLGEKIDDPRRVWGIDSLLQTAPQPPLLGGQGLAALHAAQAAQRLAEQAVRRALADQVAASEQDQGARSVRLQATHELVPQARLADARGCRHKDGLRL